MNLSICPKVTKDNKGYLSLPATHGIYRAEETPFSWAGLGKETPDKPQQFWVYRVDLEQAIKISKSRLVQEEFEGEKRAEGRYSVYRATKNTCVYLITKKQFQYNININIL